MTDWWAPWGSSLRPAGQKTALIDASNERRRLPICEIAPVRKRPTGSPTKCTGAMAAANAAHVARNCEPGVMMKQIAKDFGIHPMMLQKWMSRADIDEGSKTGQTWTEAAGFPPYQVSRWPGPRASSRPKRSTRTSLRPTTHSTPHGSRDSRPAS